MLIKNIKVGLISFFIIVMGFPIDAQQNNVKEILWTADWSPDGKLIAIGGNVNALNIYDSKGLNLTKSIPLSNTITRVKWHPTKNVIAIATQNSANKCHLYNLDTNEKIELNGISPDGARGIDWNYTGEYVAVGDNDGQILIYDLKGVLLKKVNKEDRKSITALAWHPEKNVFAIVSEKIQLIDMEGNLLKTIKHRPEEVLLLSVAWHKSGKFFVTGDYGYKNIKSLLQYWDEDGNLLYSNNTSKGEYRNLIWNSKGTRLASASDVLRIWDTKGNLIIEGSSPDYLWGVAWNKKGNRIVTSSINQGIDLWNSKGKRILKKELINN